MIDHNEIKCLTQISVSSDIYNFRAGLYTCINNSRNDYIISRRVVSYIINKEDYLLCIRNSNTCTEYFQHND